MKTMNRTIVLAALIIGTMALLAPLAALAAPIGTASGTLIGNTANLNYSVSGVTQNVVSAQSQTVAVDNKINVTVTTVNGAAVSVVPGQTSAYLTFSVTNLGNTTQDYHLIASQRAGGAAYFGGTDNFNGNNVRVFVKNGSGNTYNAGTDTATYIDELASGSSATVFIVVDIPAGQVNNDIAALDLTAQTAVGGGAGSLGADITTDDSATPKASGWTTVYKVFIDAAGTVDAAKDGKHSSGDDFKVATSMLTVTKTPAVVWDPAYYITNPKAIPGGAIKYTITISNAAGAGASATLTTVTDALNANLTMDPDLRVAANNGPYTSLSPESAVGKGFKISWGPGGGSRASFGGASGSKFYTTANDNDGVELNGQNVTLNFTTGVPTAVLPAEGSYGLGELKPGDTISLIFNVLVN